MIHLFWMMLLIVQGSGPVGLVSGTQQECEETRAKVVTSPDVLGASPCLSVTVTMNEVKGSG